MWEKTASNMNNEMSFRGWWPNRESTLRYSPFGWFALFGLPALEGMMGLLAGIHGGFGTRTTAILGVVFGVVTLCIWVAMGVQHAYQSECR